MCEMPVEMRNKSFRYSTRLQRRKTQRTKKNYCRWRRFEFWKNPKCNGLSPPKELIRLAENAVEEIIDYDLYEEMLEEEKKGISELEAFFK